MKTHFYHTKKHSLVCRGICVVACALALLISVSQSRAGVIVAENGDLKAAITDNATEAQFLLSGNTAPVTSSIAIGSRAISITSDAPGTIRTISGAGASIFTSSAGMNLTLGDIIFSNVTRNGSGGVINSTGGGSLLTLAGYVSLMNNTISSGSGGALFQNGGIMQFLGTGVFSVLNNRNTASQGGGMWVQSLVVNANVTLVVSGNTAVGSGGGIRTNSSMSSGAYSGYGAVIAGAATFNNNRAGGDETDGNDGGGLRVTNGNAWFQKTVSGSGNVAWAKGGAISVNSGGATFDAGVILVSNTTYSQTSKTAQGGAIIANGANGKLIITGTSYFENNTAAGNPNGGGTGQGGAIFAAEVQIKGGAVFKGNSALSLGGAMYLATNGGTVALTASTGDIVFKDNKAAGANNAFYLADGSKVPVVLEAAAGRTIAFYDPISGASGKTTTVSVNRNGGTGTVLFDTYNTDQAANTTVYNGMFQLSNGATYGVSGAGAFSLESSGTLGAFKASDTSLSGNGTINAGTITLKTNSTLLVRDNATLLLNAATRDYSDGINLSGWGTINAGSALTAGGIIIGNMNSPEAQTLTLKDSLTLANSTVKLDLIKGHATDPALSINDKLVLDGSAAQTFTGAMTFDFHNLLNGKYAIISAGGGMTGWTTPATLQDGAALSGRIHVTYDPAANGGKDLVASVVTNNESYNWNSAASVWDTAATGVGSSDGRFVGGDAVTFTTSGSVSITSGVTVGQLDANIASGAIVFSGGAIVADKGRSTVTSADGILHKTGAGALQFNNDSNEFAGGIIISDGAIVISKAAQLGTTLDKIQFDTTSANTRIVATDNLTIGGGETLAVGAGKSAGLSAVSGKTFVIEGAITGASNSILNINKGAENGVISFKGNQSGFLGTTNIKAGTLNLAAGSQLGGTVNIASGGVLAGAGTLAGVVNTVAGAAIQPGAYHDSAAQTLTFNNSLSLAAGTIINLDIINGDTDPLGSINDRVLSGGAINLGGAITLDVNTMSKSGVYKIMTAAGGFTGSIDFNANRPLVTVDGVAYSSPRIGTGYEISGNDLLMTIDVKNTSLHWIGGASQTWKEDSTDMNWEDNTDSGNLHRADSFVTYDRVIFDDSVTGSRSIAIMSGTLAQDVHVADMTVSGTGNYTFTGGGIIAQGDNSLDLQPQAANTLTKNGSGVLTFENNSNYFEKGIVINGGAIVATVSNLGGGNFTVNQGGTLYLASSETTQTAITGTIAGAGTLVKQGTGKVNVTGDVAIDKFVISEGSLSISQAKRVIATTLFSVEAGTTLAGSGTVTTNKFSHAGLVDLRSQNFSTLKINGNYVGETDASAGTALGTFYLYTKLTDGTGVVETDKVHITGDASGKANIRVANNGGQGGYTGKHEGEQRHLDLISIDGQSTVDFKLQGRLVKGAYEYKLDHSADRKTWYLVAPEPSPEVDAASIIPAMGRSMTFASLTNMQERMGEIISDETRRNSIWVNAVQNTDKFHTGTLDDLSVTSKMIQFGASHTFMGIRGGKGNLSVGIVGDVTEGNSDLIHDNSTITGNQKSFGAFATYQNNGWYADLVFKYGLDRYTIRTFDARVNVDTSNYTASIEAGRAFAVKSFGKFEPQVQFVYNKQSIDDMQDTFSRRYSFEAANSAQFRAGLRWYNLYDMGSFGKLIPWIRANGIYEMLGKYDFIVSGDKFTNDLSGMAFMADAGVSLEFSRDASLYFSAAWAKGAGVDNQRIAIGMRVNF